MRKTKCLKMIVIGILVVFVFTVNNVYGENSTDNNLTEVDWRSESEKMADEEYEKSGKSSYKPEVIAIYGKLPELETEEQRWNWFYKDQQAVIEGLRNRTNSYYYPAGPVISHGRNDDGYFVVAIYKNLTVNKTLLDEIYGLFDDEAKKKGIQEVPVRFVLEDFVQLDVEVEDSNKDIPASDETDNDVLPPDNTSSNSIPGLGLPGGLISLLVGWALIKRT